MAIDRPLQRGQVQNVTALGLLDGSLESGSGHHAGEIAEGPVDCGDRDSVDHRDVPGPQLTRPMQVDARARTPAGPGNRHVNAGPRGGQQLPECGGAPVAEHGAGAAGEDLGEAMAAGGQASVTVGIDPVMQTP